MLEIIVPEREFFDEVRQEFLSTPECVLQLEHSLISVSKWESIWRKPFLTDEDKTREESLSYIRCMTTTRGVPPNVYYALTEENQREVSEYIGAQQTATWFTEKKADGRPPTQTVVTSELIYYWMITYNIPSDYQKWPLSRLLTLIRICEVKARPPQKMNKADVRAQMRALNEQRRAQYQTRG